LYKYSLKKFALPGNDAHRLEHEGVNNVQQVNHVQRRRDVARAEREATQQRAGEQKKIARGFPVDFQKSYDVRRQRSWNDVSKTYFKLLTKIKIFW